MNKRSQGISEGDSLFFASAHDTDQNRFQRPPDQTVAHTLVDLGHKIEQIFSRNLAVAGDSADNKEVLKAGWNHTALQEQLEEAECKSLD